MNEFLNIEPSKVGRNDIKRLVELMYSTLDANDMIMAVLRAADRELVVSSLNELMENSDPETLCNAVELLTCLVGPSAIPQVGRLLASDDELIRWAGCHHLSKLDCPESRALLKDRLGNDSSGNVRFKAAEGLGEIGDETIVPALLLAAQDDLGTDFEGRPIKQRALVSIDAIARRAKTE